MRGHGNLEDALHIVKVAADNFQRSAAADLTEERRLRFGQRHCAYILRDGCRLNAMVLAQPFIDGLVAKIAGIIYQDRKSDVEGKDVSVLLDIGGRRIINQKNKTT